MLINLEQIPQDRLLGAAADLFVNTAKVVTDSRGIDSLDGFNTYGDQVYRGEPAMGEVPVLTDFTVQVPREMAFTQGRVNARILKEADLEDYELRARLRNGDERWDAIGEPFGQGVARVIYARNRHMRLASFHEILEVTGLVGHRLLEISG